MNGNPHEQHERRRPIPEPERERELAESTGTPDAVGAAHIRRDDQEHTPAGRRARGVEWVRPTDLIARHSASLSGRGIDFEAELARRARVAADTGDHKLALQLVLDAQEINDVLLQDLQALATTTPLSGA